MADFGTCAVDWPLLDEWEEELAQGKRISEVREGEARPSGWKA